MAQDVMPQLSNIAVIFVVTFVVFPGVAASWAPQLEFFTSKGPLELKNALGKCKLEVWGSSIFIFYTHGRYGTAGPFHFESQSSPKPYIEPVFFESQVILPICKPTLSPHLSLYFFPKQVYLFLLMAGWMILPGFFVFLLICLSSLCRVFRPYHLATCMTFPSNSCIPVLDALARSACHVSFLPHSCARCLQCAMSVRVLPSSSCLVCPAFDAFVC